MKILAKKSKTGSISPLFGRQLAGLLLPAALTISLGATAQTYIEGDYYVSGNTYEYADEVVVQAGTNVYVGPGDWVLYGKNVTFQPSVNFVYTSGSPRIYLDNTVDGGNTAGALQLSGGGSTIPQGITVVNSNPAGVNMVTGNNLTIGGNLLFASSEFDGTALTSGNYWTVNDNKLIFNSTGTTSGYDDSRYIITNNNAGEVHKEAMATGNAFFYPIGRDVADYSPVNLSVMSGGPVDYYTNVRNYVESVPPNDETLVAAQPNIARTWLVYGSAAGSMAHMDFIHDVFTETGGYNNLGSTVMRYEIGGVWQATAPLSPETESAFGTPAGYFSQVEEHLVQTTPGVNAFYTKSSTTLVALPIGLANFTAKKLNSYSQLNWVAVNASAVKSYAIGRSINGSSWQSIGTVPATLATNYAFTDLVPASGANFYRIAGNSADGKKDFSMIRILNFSSKLVLAAYPNPVKGILNLTGLNAGDKVSMLNVAGQRLLTLVAAGNSADQINMNALAAGTYLLQVTNKKGDNSTTLKVVKK